MREHSWRFITFANPRLWAKAILGFAIAILFIVTISCATSDTAAEVGKRAPDFTLNNIDGQSVKLSDFAGKVVVVNIWATWCPPCRAEIPDLQSAYEKYKEQGVVFLGVNSGDQQDEVRKFLTQQNITFPILLDLDSKITMAYNTDSLPTTFFVGSDGIISVKRIGQMNEKIIRDGLTSASKGAIK